MTTRIVEWSSGDKLACSACLPADVYLCVRSGLVPPLILLFTTHSKPMHTIDASVTAVTKNNCNCETPYTYTIEYDADQLVGSVELISSDISGVVCKGCLTSVIEDTIFRVLEYLFSKVQ